MYSKGINNAIKLNSHLSLWIKWSKAGAHIYVCPPLTASSSVGSQPSAAIPYVSYVPAPLISVVHTLCPSVWPPTLIPVSSLWHPVLSMPFSFHPVGAIAVARLPSLVVKSFSCCYYLSMCLTMESFLFPRVHSESANQQCNETRLPSSACWDITSLSQSCTTAAKTEQYCHLLWMQIQLTS